MHASVGATEGPQGGPQALSTRGPLGTSTALQTISEQEGHAAVWPAREGVPSCRACAAAFSCERRPRVKGRGVKWGPRAVGPWGISAPGDRPGGIGGPGNGGHLHRFRGLSGPAVRSVPN